VGKVTAVVSTVVRTFASWRSVSAALGVLACLTTALALSAAPALACPNEQLRQESSVDPATGQPYSAGLPDCRAYEMVSPLYKQSHGVLPTNSGVAVATSGEAFGFESEGDFGEPAPENYEAGAYSPALKYTSRRGASGWTTSSTFAPAKLVYLPTILAGLNADFTPDLRSSQVSCGVTNPGPAEVRHTEYVCAMRTAGGVWKANTYTALGNSAMTTSSGSYLGGSADLSRVFVQPLEPLEPKDHLITLGSKGIYEMTGVGSESAQLRLVNVDNKGEELAISRKQGGFAGPLIGAERETEPNVKGTAYHAISDSGETVFFTATPAGSSNLTIYARIACASGPSCVQGRETVAVSNPSLNVSDPALNVSGSTTSPWECKKCQTGPEAQGSATFQGASADGSKVFFTTKQQLLSKDSTLNLYEYNLKAPEGEKLVLLSRVPELESANVKGVLRTSSDGAVVYFVATGLLSEVARNRFTNAKGEVVEEGPTAGKANLYAYDTNTPQVKFVANIEASLGELYNSSKEESLDSNRHAQTTPDGRYLVFSSKGPLAGDTNVVTAQGVYRYQFETGELTWISHAAPAGEEARGCGIGTKCTGNEGQSAWVAPLPGTENGGEADIGDWSRAISGCPHASENATEGETAQCPEEKYDGEYVIFATAEKLQNDDKNEAVDVYEWHCSSPCPNPAAEGVVSMISDGYSAAGASGIGGAGYNGEGLAGMSASGSDIFYLASTSLVGQDGDVLRDAYDARVNGGFSAPPAAPQCSPEACQGTQSGPSSFAVAASSVFGAGGNLSSVGGGVLGFKIAKPKPLTAAQKLAKAVKACKGKPRKKRLACESLARKRYGPKAKSKAKKAQARGK
jgi:hypothetical protein